METCKTCKRWSPIDGSGGGICKKFAFLSTSPTKDGIRLFVNPGKEVDQKSHCYFFGPDFGCIHHKTMEKS